MATLLVRNSTRRLTVSQAALGRFFARLVEALKLGANTEASVTFVGPRKIAALKREHFGSRVQTDCIAFSTDLGRMPGGVRLLGEIVLCPAVIRANAEEHGKSFADEMLFVLTHGVLHLLGWDDATPAQRAAMWRRQEWLVERCRVPGRVFAWSATR